MNLLLDSALKATVILFAAWTATLVLRRASSGVRHMIWLAALLAVAIVPVVLSIPQSAIPSAALIMVPALIVVPALTAAPEASHKIQWLLIVWTAGAAIVLLRLIAGIATVVRITRSAHLRDGILYSDRAATPITWGFLRPVVILPAYAIEWSAAERDLVILHEQAHIARHDWLWQTLSSAMTAVLWFHPLMWLANLELRREAEGAVDDRVLADGVAPTDYAGCLVDVARQLRGLRVPAPVIAMVRKPDLETRVRSILDPSRRRAGAGLLVRSAIVIAAAALIFPIAVTRQSVQAQGKVYKIGDGVSQPRIIHKVEPQYTPEAKDDKIEGTVQLRLEITADGFAQNIHVTKSLDPGLDANAMTAVSQWRFKPGMKDGEPVAVYAAIEVTFHLL
jgi:TonB family protein